MKTPRQIVVEALCHMEKHQAWSSPTIISYLNKAKLPEQDRSFASALFYGTLTYMYTLDICIKQYSKTPFSKLDTTVKNILRTAIYQILYMDSVPQHAAVDEAVNLTRAMRKARSSGFVNGILRAFLRDGAEIPKPKKKGLNYSLGVEYSCPPNLVNFWLTHYGEENTRKILENSLKAPPTFLRVNTNKASADELIEMLENEGIEAAKTQLPNCLTTQSQGAINQSKLYKDGYFHIQDISSQMAALATDSQEGHQVLDCCAAPGGKTFVISQQVGSSGHVTACDLHQHRINELEDRAKVLELENITTHTLDMTEYHSELGSFDRVICDAPCSGYGTIRRSPEIKYKELDEFAQLPELQLELLDTASKYCKIQGILVYSTCTLSPRENQQVVAKFLENNPNFARVDILAKSEETIFIGENGGDGFFISVLIRKA